MTKTITITMAINWSIDRLINTFFNCLYNVHAHVVNAFKIAGIESVYKKD